MGMMDKGFRNVTSIPRKIGVLPEETKSIEGTVGMVTGREEKKRKEQKTVLTGMAGKSLGNF